MKIIQIAVASDHENCQTVLGLDEGGIMYEFYWPKAPYTRYDKPVDGQTGGWVPLPKGLNGVIKHPDSKVE